MDPTGEQQAIIDAYRTGRNLVIEAGAGTGKTTTLKMLGADKPGRKGTAGEPEPLAGLERELRRQSRAEAAVGERSHGRDRLDDGN